MQNLSWQELIPGCFDVEDLIFASSSSEILKAKRMIEAAYYAAASESEVQREISRYLTEQQCPVESVKKQIARFQAAWVWAQPLGNWSIEHQLDSATRLLGGALVSLEAESFSTSDIEKVVPEIRKARKLVQAARFSNGCQMTSAESELEVDPASGKEVYVFRPEEPN